MNIYAWVGMLGILVFSLLPLLKAKNRTKEKMKGTALTLIVWLGIILAVFVFNVNFAVAFLVGFVLLIIFEKKTYTKKGLITYGVISLVLVIAVAVLLRDNPDYVLGHLENHPETSSFYAAENGEELIAYAADTVHPLASTVKILIAAEYAMQVHEGKLDPEHDVSLAELNRFYVKDTDGGAHERWLDEVKAQKLDTDGKVPLEEVAAGMVTYSSNANTDYLIGLLGADNINKRAEELGLKSHEPVYPVVGALLIPYQFNKYKEDSGNALRALPMEEYRQLAFEISEEMKDGKIQTADLSYDAPLSIQRVWSDRLPGDTARDYAKLLAMISQDEWPDQATEIMRELMEWPMKLNPGNEKRFRHLGSKGGSTAFVLNDALYAEELDGDRYELVLLMDDLRIWQSLLLQRNLNSFESKFIGDEQFRMKVRERLDA